MSGQRQKDTCVVTVSAGAALCFHSSGYYLFDDNQLIIQVVERQPSKTCSEVNYQSMAWGKSLDNEIVFSS